MLLMAHSCRASLNEAHTKKRQAKKYPAPCERITHALYGIKSFFFNVDVKPYVVKRSRKDFFFFSALTLVPPGVRVFPVASSKAFKASFASAERFVGT